MVCALHDALFCAAVMLPPKFAALQLAGGILLVCFGLYTYFAAPAHIDPKAEAKEQGASTLARAMVSTFALTMTNPATLFGFTAMFTGLGGLTGDDPSFFGAAFVVAGVVAGSALWWLMLTTFVGRLHGKIDDGVVRIINHGSGLLVAVFGLIVLGHVALKFI